MCVYVCVSVMWAILQNFVYTFLGDDFKSSILVGKFA